jgi:hypothetical protein
MTDRLTERLNEILPKLISEEFLSGRGIGNEIGFYIFDYPPEEELRIRDHIAFLVEHLPKHRKGLLVKHINLFDFVINHLKERNLLERAFKLEQQKGDRFLLKQLEKILHPGKIAPLFAKEAEPEKHDLVLVSGIGSVYPMFRAHSLLISSRSIPGIWIGLRTRSQRYREEPYLQRDQPEQHPDLRWANYGRQPLLQHCPQHHGAGRPVGCRSL